MLRKHSLTVAMINRDSRTAYLMRDYFDLPRATTLMASLVERGLGQADLVLCLLRLRDARTAYSRVFSSYVTMLVGHPIVVGPSCLLRYGARSPRPTPARSADDRRVTYVATDNPRQPSTEAHLRWCEYRVGRTVGQLLVRGVTKRDIRRSVRRGWIKVEELA